MIASENTTRTVCMSFWTSEEAILNFWNFWTDFIRFMFNKRTSWDDWFAKDVCSVPCKRWNSRYQIWFELLCFLDNPMRLAPSTIITINAFTVIDTIFCIGKSEFESIVANSCAHATFLNTIFSLAFALPWSKVDCTQIWAGATFGCWWWCCCWCKQFFGLLLDSKIFRGIFTARTTYHMNSWILCPRLTLQIWPWDIFRIKKEKLDNRSDTIYIWW